LIWYAHVDTITKSEDPASLISYAVAGRGQKTEDRRQKAEDRRQEAEGRRQKAEDRRQKAEGRIRRMEMGSE
jgi:hypothetical protein